MKTVYLDIMIGERFFCQLKYKFCPAFAITEKELTEFVESMKPSLHGKKYSIIPTHQRA